MNKINNIYKNSKTVSAFARSYFDYLHEILNTVSDKEINEFVKKINKCRVKGNTIFVVGNGGSSTTATTIVNDLGFDILKKTSTDKPFKFLSLNDNNAVITAIANDVSFDEIFLNQLKIHYKKNDVLLVISASGNSKNLISAAKFVKSKKGKVMSLLGFDGGKLLNMSDLSIHFKTNKGEYGPTEDAHLILNHIIAHWFQNVLK